MKLELSASLTTLTIICNPKSIIPLTINQATCLYLVVLVPISENVHWNMFCCWTNELCLHPECFVIQVLYYIPPEHVLHLLTSTKVVFIHSLRYIEMIVHKKILAWFQTTPSLILRSRRSLIESDRVQTSCHPGRWRWVKQTEISSWNPVKIFKSPPHLKAKQCTMCNIIYSTQEAKETFIQMNTYNSL